MNPLTLDEAKSIANSAKRGAKALKKTEVVICPPFVYISPLSNLFGKSSGSNLFLGAQDAFYEPVGHFTGEVSFAELPQFKVSYVIIGHSERRGAGETDATINKKIRFVVS